MPEGHSFRRSLVRAAWLEYRCNAAFRGRCGQYASFRRKRQQRGSDNQLNHPVGEMVEFAVEVPDAEYWLEETAPPKWFVEEELGFRFDCGPSLEWVCTTLARTNRAAAAQLGREAPKKFTYPIHDTRARSWRPRREDAGRARRGESLSKLMSDALRRWGVRRHGETG